MLELDIINQYNGYEKRKSLRGNEYAVWSPIVPRIHEELLDCVIYLYKTEYDAREGERTGGSGFLVGIPSKFSIRPYIYAVTCSHVIREGQSPIIRMNTKDGRMDVLKLKDENWIHHPDGDDLAVCPIAFPHEKFHYNYIGQDRFLTNDIIDKFGIGAGDDVFSIGRFVNHEGKQRNTPVVRFGNIAMMPYEPVRHPRGIDVESFLIETRSLSGFSGSPVFIHIPPKSLRWGKGITQGYGLWLLGVDWGHFPIRDDNTQGSNYLSVKWYNTGIAPVSPIWKLVELLNVDLLKKQRNQSEASLEKENGRSNVVLDTQGYSRSHFMSDLKKVSQKKPDGELL